MVRKDKKLLLPNRHCREIREKIVHIQKIIVAYAFDIMCSIPSGGFSMYCFLSFSASFFVLAGFMKNASVFNSVLEITFSSHSRK